MLVTELHGVEIDICPACGGLWFDGEELAQLAGAARRAETDRPVPVAETCTRPCQVCGAHGEVTAVTWHRGLWRCGACRMSAGVAEAERLDRLQRKYAEQWRRREGESRALQSVGAAMKRMFMSPRRRWFHW